MTLNVCEFCKYWKQDKDAMYHGECHRYAPAPQMDNMLYRGGAEEDRESDKVLRSVYWPYTEADEFCGDFEDNGLTQVVFIDEGQPVSEPPPK